jgi:hypothetical protein
MRSILLHSFIFTLIVSCNESATKSPCERSDQSCRTSTLLPQEGDNEIPETGIPEEAFSFSINLTLVNFSSAQEDKIHQAAELIKKVVATEKFKDAVIDHTYEGEKIFVDNQRLSNIQIYNKFLQGAEELNPFRNNTMDVELELYYENNSTIGYTYPNTRRIWMNTKYFDRYTAAQVAGNLTHEWMHKLGFTHATSYSPSRCYSVPYAIGYIIQKLIPQVGY